MKRTLTLVVALVALAAANPYMTILSEFAANDSGSSWVELHCLPEEAMMDSWPLTGTLLRTSTSVCTLSGWLCYGQFLVIDSEALAQGVVGRGTFRLNPDSDFIRVEGGFNPESVCYPRLPTGFGCSAVPPVCGSVCFWNINPDDSYVFNWYVDSTPTPGDSNRDWSSISGTVSADSGLDVFWVIADGPFGHSIGLDSAYSYQICGLGAGHYSVEAWGYRNQRPYHGILTDVAVGYAEACSGIDIYLWPSGVEERHAGPNRTPELRVCGGELDVLCPTPVDARLKVFDQTGACRAVLYEGRLESGRHRFELSSRVGAGVYFVRLATQFDKTTRKVVVMH